MLKKETLYKKLKQLLGRKKPHAHIPTRDLSKQEVDWLRKYLEEDEK